MKTVYIPKGETVSYESLVTDRLIIKGCLKVTYGIKAKTISGSGMICAGTIEANTICLDDVEAASVICKRLIAKRVQTPELFASESAAVSCFLSAAYVEAGKLTVAISEVDEVKAQEVVNLTPKRRSLLGTLLASMLRSFWTILTVSGEKSEVVDADFVPVAESPAEPKAEQSVSATEQEAEQSASETTQSDAEQTDQTPSMSVIEGRKENQVCDEELNRVIAMFQLLRQSGYTLRIIPGTPEQNAPVFDFEQERIIRPAA